MGEQLLNAITVGRVAQPHEVAAVARFLASVENSCVTGAVIDVSGGLLIE